MNYLAALEARRASLPGRPASAAPAALLDCLSALQPSFPEDAEGSRKGVDASGADDGAAAVFESLRAEGGFVRGPEQDASEALTWLLDAVAEEAAAVWKLPGGGKTGADQKAFLDGLLDSLELGNRTGTGEEEEAGEASGEASGETGKEAGASPRLSPSSSSSSGSGSAASDASTPSALYSDSDAAPSSSSSAAPSSVDASAARSSGVIASRDRLISSALPRPPPHHATWLATTPLPFEGTTVQTLRCLKCHEELDSTATTFRLLTLPLVEPHESSNGVAAGAGRTAVGVPVEEGAGAARAARAGASPGAPPSAASLEVLADSPLLAPFIAAGRAQARRDMAGRPTAPARTGPQTYSLRDSFTEAFSPEIAGPYMCKLCAQKSKKAHAEAMEAWESAQRTVGREGEGGEGGEEEKKSVAKADGLATEDQAPSPSSTLSSPRSALSSLSPPPPEPPVPCISSVLRRSMLGRTPRALILHLDRVAWDPTRGPVKRTGHVSFPAIFRIDALAPRWGEEPREQGRAAKVAAFDTQETLKLYELSAIVEHAGAAETGHYVTWRRLRHPRPAAAAAALPPPSDPTDPWARVSDDQVRLGGLRDALGANASLLFYDLVELHPKEAA